MDFIVIGLNNMDMIIRYFLKLGTYMRFYNDAKSITKRYLTSFFSIRS